MAVIEGLEGVGKAAVAHKRLHVMADNARDDFEDGSGKVCV